MTDEFDKRIRVGEGVQPRVVRVVHVAERPESDLVALGELGADDGDRRTVVEPPGFAGGSRLASASSRSRKSSRSSSRRTSSSASVRSVRASRCGPPSRDRVVAKNRAYVASRPCDGKVDLLTFSQAESVDTATGSSSDSAWATSPCLSRTPGNCE